MPVRFIRNFLRLEAASGVLLFVMAIFALILSNSPLATFYHHFLDATLSLQFGGASFETEPLLFWVNEGLMTIFFLLVGLELKREFLEGELSGFAKIVLPAVAALGGMLIPAIIYFAFNHQSEMTLKGWAIPVATDIAFALGVLSLFNSRVPIGLKLFLMALAIFDDVGAIIIIALFYSHSVSLLFLGLSGVILFLLWFLNAKWQVRLILPYLVLGLLLWFCVLHSGVHASIAGVLLSAFIPLRSSKKENKKAPLHYLEETLHPWVVFFVMPIFAFANAGLSFAGMSWKALLEPIVLGTSLGLFLGKQLGVLGFTWLLLKSGIAKLPSKVTWSQLYGVALLCGIGFTMSLFLGTLAFQSERSIYLSEVRLGVLLGSLMSGVFGAMVLKYAFRKK